MLSLKKESELERANERTPGQRAPDGVFISNRMNRGNKETNLYLFRNANSIVSYANVYIALFKF